MEAELLAGGLNSSPSGGAARDWRFLSTAPLLPWEGHNPHEDWWTCFWQNMVSYYTARFQGLHKVITGCYRFMILTLQISVQVTYLINYKEEIPLKESDFLGTKCPCIHLCIRFLHRRYRPKVSVGEWSPKLDSDFTPNGRGEGFSATDTWYAHYTKNAMESQVPMSRSILLQTKRKGKKDTLAER